jgi:hypothetical protein
VQLLDELAVDLSGPGFGVSHGIILPNFFDNHIIKDKKCKEIISRFV